VFKKDMRADIIFSDPYCDFIFCRRAALASVSASIPDPLFPPAPGRAVARVAFLEGSNPSISALNIERSKFLLASHSFK